MKIGMFPMVGDLLHAGHLSALREAKANCDHLIVAMNVNPVKDNASKNPPVESVYERYLRLKSCKYIDEIIPYEGEKDLELLLATTPYNVRFVGSDHANKHRTGIEYEVANSIELHIINREYHGLSSTDLRDRIVKSAKKPTKQ